MSAPATSAARRRNVIWVMADQLRAQATGYAGDPNVSTPNLDRLVAEGVDFTNAAAASPLCCPARGSMLTGRFASASGVPGHQSPLAADAPTLAREFTAAGYRTCYVGKWHLDGNRPELGPATFGDEHARIRMIPPARRAGFDDWWAYENNNRPFDCLVHTDAGRVPDGVPVLARADGMEQFRLPGYETDALTDLLIDWLTGRPADEPFFAVLSVQPPHNPYIAPAEDMARHVPAKIGLRANVPPVERIRTQARRDLAGYYAGIERLDHNVGRLRSTLARLGLADDTYLVFFSDHGDMHGSHGQFRKTNPWEESVRVPLVVGGPSRTNGRRCQTLATHVDLAPTTLGLCDLPTPAWMQGADLSAVVTGGPAQPDPVRDILIEQPVPTGHRESIDLPWSAIITHDGWKYATLDGRPWMMFDLGEDPYELADHAHDPAYRARRDQLAESLARLQRHAATG